jgi:hypothetical protein
VIGDLKAGSGLLDIKKHVKTVKSQRNEGRLFNPPQKSTDMIHVAKVNQSWDYEQLDTQ